MKKTAGHNPLPLRRGDTIGLFCPAGPVRNMARVNQGISLLREKGFSVCGHDNLREQVDGSIYLAASDEKRVREITHLLQDDAVKALMAVRGGYGCLRLLQRINYSLFQQHPKLVIGFSDLTGLLAATFHTCGLVGLHGPVLSTLAGVDVSSQERFFSLLNGDYPPYIFPETLQILRTGTSRGRLVVGNLTTLIHLLGTPWEPMFSGSILILEDTGESMYRIDRMLTHLSCADKLTGLSGLILGTFDYQGNTEAETHVQQQLRQRVLELCQGYEYPIWSNFPLGHLEANHAIPFGMEATMDSGSASLTLHPETCSPESFTG